MAATVPGMGRPKKAEPSGQIRLPRSMILRVRAVAGHLGKDPGDLAAELLSAPLADAERGMFEEMARRMGEQPRGKGGKK